MCYQYDEPADGSPVSIDVLNNYRTDVASVTITLIPSGDGEPQVNDIVIKVCIEEPGMCNKVNSI